MNKEVTIDIENPKDNDLISRQAVLDLAKKGVLVSNGNHKSVCKAINELPPVNPTKIGHWIPISEISPNDGEWAIFTDGAQISVERYKMDALDHFFPSGRWFNLEDAVAWMPLPGPYKAENEDI